MYNRQTARKWQQVEEGYSVQLSVSVRRNPFVVCRVGWWAITPMLDKSPGGVNFCAAVVINDSRPALSRLTAASHVYNFLAVV